VATYTYDPAQISLFNKHRMRFELGDTQIDGGKDTCALCDEEYDALLGEGIGADGWRAAKIRCLEAIVARFAMAVDFSAGGASFSLSQRYDRWNGMLITEKKRRQMITANPHALGEGCEDGGHNFWLGQQNNPRSGFERFGR